MKDLPALWEEFSKMSINNLDEIETNFLHFPPLTSRLEIWHWFDKNHLTGVVGLMAIKQDYYY